MADAQLNEIRRAQAARYQSLSAAERPRLRKCDACGEDVYTRKICPLSGYYHDLGDRTIVGGRGVSKDQRRFTGKELMDSLAASRVKWQPARVSAVKVDSDSIGIFQSFTMERQWKAMHYGIMYGTYDAATSAVAVHAIYEPEQEVGNEGFKPLPDPHTPKADAIAEALGFHPVGVICTHAQRNPDAMMVSGMELLLTIRLASIYGPHCVLITIGPNEQLQAINGVAWQVSEQAIELFRLGILSNDTSNPAMLRSTVALEVAQEVDEKGKRSVVTKEPSTVIDCRWLIAPVAIESFASQVLQNRFMRLTRPGTPPPTLANLKAYLEDPKRRTLPMDRRIADFHTLIFMAVHLFDMKSDMPIILNAVRNKRPNDLVHYETIIAEYLKHHT